MSRSKENKLIVGISSRFALRVEIIPSDNDRGGIRGATSLRADTSSVWPIEAKESCKLLGCSLLNNSQSWRDLIYMKLGMSVSNISSKSPGLTFVFKTANKSSEMMPTSRPSAREH